MLFIFFSHAEEIRQIQEDQNSCINAGQAGVPAEIFLVEVFRPENFPQWKFTWKTLASRSFPVAASYFFPERKHTRFVPAKTFRANIMKG